MTKYTIANIEIEISTEVENYRYYIKTTNPLINQAEDLFDTWYNRQSDVYSVYKNADDILVDSAFPLIDKVVEILNDQGVYSINCNNILNKVSPGSFQSFEMALDKMIDEYAQVDKDKRNAEIYRQQRKAARGRVVGGGFGLGGAVKGMMTAGAINMATGTAHSLVNAVGNAGSSMAAGINKHRLYAEYRPILREKCIEGVKKLRYELLRVIQSETNLCFKPLTKDETSMAEAIRDNYKKGRIPKEQKAIQIVQALVLNPYNEEVYFIIWEEYGDVNGELSKLADYFGIGLSDKIKSLINTYAQKIFEQNCKEVISSTNEIIAAVKFETNIKMTVNDIKVYCSQHGVDENYCQDILGQCEKLLGLADIYNRTVKKVLYDTKEIADKVRNDYQIFYDFLKSKEILDEETFKELKKIDFKSQQFSEGLEKIYSEEIDRRNIEKINQSISSIIFTYMNKEDLPEQVILGGALPEIETQIAGLINMDQKEQVLFMLGKDPKWKSAIMITNECFRFFSFGFLSKINLCVHLDNISNITYQGNDIYLIHLNNNKTENIKIKYNNLSIEKQNDFAEMLQEIVFLLQNISTKQRQKIYRMFHSAYKCVCGEYLLRGEKICPTCKRILTLKGELVESCICPKCGSYVINGKKYCTNCGSSLIKNDFAKDVDTKEEDKAQLIEKNTPELEEKAEMQIASIKRCVKCGNEIKIGKKFCTKCGTKIQEELPV